MFFSGCYFITRKFGKIWRSPSPLQQRPSHCQGTCRKFPPIGNLNQDPELVYMHILCCTSLCYIALYLTRPKKSSWATNFFLCIYGLWEMRGENIISNSKNSRFSENASSHSTNMVNSWSLATWTGERMFGEIPEKANLGKASALRERNSDNFWTGTNPFVLEYNFCVGK